MNRELDLTQAQWRKSSYSGGDNDCVELAVFDDRIAIRDSKCPDRSPLVVARADARAFIDCIQAGQWT
ncbi:DUF397 domain-containing protein [Streptomyces sp. NPDC127033]|uniref:DUF397 domain-containing protein n=1 Tax=Streptomyces sp. NPDC127033 TaxID=3347110 RepID=UPI003662433E